MIVWNNATERMVIREVSKSDHYLNIQTQTLRYLFGIPIWVTNKETLIDKNFDDINTHKNVDDNIYKAWAKYKEAKNNLIQI